MPLTAPCSNEPFSRIKRSGDDPHTVRQHKFAVADALAVRSPKIVAPVPTSLIMRDGRKPPRVVTSSMVRRRIMLLLHNLVSLPVLLGLVLFAPYTKVEESFGIHVVHDVLAWPFTKEGLAKWDHIVFPGAVPRSFLPSILLGLICWPVASLSVAFGWIETAVGVQTCVRLVLAFFHAMVLAHLSRTIRQKYGATQRNWFMALSLSQFHIPYYAGRTLPNSYALLMVLLSISLILKTSPSIPAAINRARYRKAIIILTATATVIRLELALFVLPTVLSLIRLRKITWREGFTWGAIGGFGSLLISATLDLALWRPTLAHPDFPFTSPWQLVWPELSALYFNVGQNKAAEWGVQPAAWYFTHALPKICLASLPLAALGLVSRLSTSDMSRKAGKVMSGIDEIARQFGLGVFVLLCGMSSIGHKEWRFVIYVVPIINIWAALSAAALWDMPYPRLRPLARLGLLGLLAGNIAFTGVSTSISAQNYPGGEVWRILEQVRADVPLQSQTIVHFDNLPLQTGSTLFTFLHVDRMSGAFPRVQGQAIGSQWTYSKSEDPVLNTPAGAWQGQVDYVVTDNTAFESWTGREGQRWTVQGRVDGFQGVMRDGWRVRVKRGTQLSVYGRAGGR